MAVGTQAVRVAFNVFPQLPLRKHDSAVPGGPSPVPGNHARTALTTADADKILSASFVPWVLELGLSAEELGR
jgi:hypothetical protein